MNFTLDKLEIDNNSSRLTTEFLSEPFDLKKPHYHLTTYLSCRSSLCGPIQYDETNDFCRSNYSTAICLEFFIFLLLYFKPRSAMRREPASCQSTIELTARRFRWHCLSSNGLRPYSRSLGRTITQAASKRPDCQRYWLYINFLVSDVVVVIVIIVS